MREKTRIRVLRRIAALLTVWIAMAGCTSWSAVGHVVSADRRTESGADAPEREIGGWRIKVSVAPSSAPPLLISVGPPRAAPANDARPWVQHELIVENRGDRPIRFADTRTSTFIGASGRRMLLAADEGCGYAPQTRKSPIEAGVCTLHLDAPTLEPHVSIRRTITLFKGLRGMDPLTEGTHVFEKVIRFRIGGTIPAEGTGRTVVVRLFYEIERVPG